MRTLFLIIVLAIPTFAQRQSQDRDCPAPKGFVMNEGKTATITTIQKSLATDSYWYTPTSWVGDLDKKRTPARKVRRSQRHGRK